jgi:hypothetical protein
MTWDTLDTTPYFANLMTISGGGLTATGISAVLNGGGNSETQALAMPFEGKSAGLFCVEAFCVNGGSYDAFGVTSSCAIGGFIGATGGADGTGQAGIGYKQDGDINYNRLYLIGQNPIVTWGRWGTGDYLYAAMNLNAKYLAFRVNGGPWLGLTDTADPVTGAGCIPLSAYPIYGDGNYWPCASFIQGAEYRFNFGQSAFAHPAPAGFTPGWTNTGKAQFGSTLACGEGHFTGAPKLCVSPYLCPFNGVITTLQSEGNDSGTTAAIGLVYDSDGPGGGPGTLLAKSSSASLTPFPGYVRYLLTSPLTVVAGHTYYLGVFVTPNGPYSSIRLSGGSALNDLWIDNTVAWPTPNASFVQSAHTTDHIAMIAAGAISGGGGGGGGGYSFGEII